MGIWWYSLEIIFWILFIKTYVVGTRLGNSHENQHHVICFMNFMIWATSWENLFMQYANNKGADQPAHPRSLISTFVVHWLDSIIPLSFYIQNFKLLPSFCGCAGQFESTLVTNTEDRFSRDKAHIILQLSSNTHLIVSLWGHPITYLIHIWAQMSKDWYDCCSIMLLWTILDVWLNSNTCTGLRRNSWY